MRGREESARPVRTEAPAERARTRPLRAVPAGPAALSAVLTLAALAACGGEGPEPSGEVAAGDATVRDSAGVRIVEADWDALPVLDTVGPQPLYVLGETEGAPLHQVDAVRLLPDGRLAVGENQPARVVVVDTATGATTILAEQGEGPGEVGAVWALFVEDGGAAVGVLDSGRDRYVVFDLQGEVLRERSLVGSGVGSPQALVPGPDGVLFLAQLTRLPQTDGVSRPELPLVRLADETADTVARFPGRTVFRGGGGVGMVVFGAATHLAPAPDGVWIGDSAERSVVLRSPDGAVERIVRWTRSADRTLTDARLDEVLDEAFEQVPEARRAAARDQFMSTMPFPDRVPAYGDILVDAEGALWVGDFQKPVMAGLAPPSEPRSWALFAGDGSPLGRVVTPPRVQVLDVGGDWLAGVHRDELGVETVRLYRLER